MGLARRWIARIAVVLALPLVSSTALAAAHAKKKTVNLHPTVDLLALSSHKVFHLRPDVRGRFGQKELAGFRTFMRCHHTGRAHWISPRLAALLYETGVHFHADRLLVVAGYRAPTIAKKKGNPKSPHKAGLACDFRIESVANTKLRDYLRWAFNKVGVGYYPNSDFVHLDVRQKSSAFWVDYSGPGERARYAKHPEDAIKDTDGADEGEENAVADSALATDSTGALAGASPSTVAPPPATAIGGELPQNPVRPRASAPNEPTPAAVTP